MPKSKARYKFNKFVNVAEKTGLISPLVHIGQFLRDCKAVLPESEINFHMKDDFSTTYLSREMGVSENTVEELKEVCKPSTLNCSRESEICSWNDPMDVPDDVGLLTPSHWKRHNETRNDKEIGRNRNLKSKYSDLSCALLERAQDMPASSSSEAIKCPEVIITVCVCFSWTARCFRVSGVDYRVLGSQKLTELRDKILCALDEQPIGDFTSNPDCDASVKLKDICTSSLFFIENTFYNDLRKPTSVDLSKYILRWAKEGGTPITKGTKSVLMHNRTFNDLHLRLGCPYVFLHQGDCEHTIVFKDIRLFNANDCQSRSSYPLAVGKGFCKGSPCQICLVHGAKWSTRWDELAESDPAVFCERCFRILHYDKKGNRLGNFLAFKKINDEKLDFY